MNLRFICVALCAFAFVLLSPSRAEARGCTEVSDIVGKQKCSRYGRLWSLEGQFPIISRFGARFSQLSTADTTFTESTAKQTRPPNYRAYRYSGESLGVKSLNTTGLDGGIGFFIWGQLYLAVEGGFALGSATVRSFTTASGVSLSGDTGINLNVFHAGIPIGYRIPLGRASLRGELFTGLASLSIDHQVHTAGLPDTGVATQNRVLLEPRIAGDIWFTQHISFGVYAGVNVLDTDGRSRALGLSLTWHNRAFDGDSY